MGRRNLREHKPSPHMRAAEEHEFPAGLLYVASTTKANTRIQLQSVFCPFVMSNPHQHGSHQIPSGMQGRLAYLPGLYTI